MPILQITTNVTGLSGVTPRVIYINTNDTMVQVTTPGYLNDAVGQGYIFFTTDIALVSTIAAPGADPVGEFYQIIHVDGNWSLDLLPNSGGVNPGLQNDLAYYASTGAYINPLPTANSGVLTTDGSGVPGWIGPMVNGQLPIGFNGGRPVAANLIAGAGIVITNGPGSISITATGGTSWVDQTTAAVTMNINTGYTIDAGNDRVTLTLPLTSTYGDFVEINGKSAGGWTIALPTGRRIHVGSVATLAGPTGSVSSTNQFDCVRLRCVTQNFTWDCVYQQSGGLNIV